MNTVCLYRKRRWVRLQLDVGKQICDQLGKPWSILALATCTTGQSSLAWGFFAAYPASASVQLRCADWDGSADVWSGRQAILSFHRTLRAKSRWKIGDDYTSLTLSQPHVSGHSTLGIACASCSVLQLSWGICTSFRSLFVLDKLAITDLCESFTLFLLPAAGLRGVAAVLRLLAVNAPQGGRWTLALFCPVAEAPCQPPPHSLSFLCPICIVVLHELHIKLTHFIADKTFKKVLQY